jgi:hypothetical protein
MNTTGWICCQPLPANFPMDSPFGKFLSLGYYDGTTSGVSECSNCSSLFRYKLVAWDSGQDMRIYSIASLPPSSFESIVKLLTAVEEPRWPFWRPKLSPLTGSEMSSLGAAIDAELSNAKLPTHVVAAEHLDKRILAGRELSATGLGMLPKDHYPGFADWDFWRTYLALDQLEGRRGDSSESVD